MTGSNLYSDQVITSSGNILFSTLATTASQTSAITAAIAAQTPDMQVSTTLYTGAGSGTPTNTTLSATTIGTITTSNSIANKYCTMFIPISVTPTAASTVVNFLLQLTGSTLTVISAAFDSFKTGTDAVIMKDVSTNGTANQLSVTFGPNTTGAHTGIIRIVATHT